MLLALGLALPTLTEAACKLNAIEMPVTMIDSRAVAKVVINGTEVPMTIDSGAFYSFLTDAAAAQLQLPVTQAPFSLQAQGVTGHVNTRMTTVKRLQLTDGEFPDVEFIVGGNEPGAGTMGLLGRNLLSGTDIEYDLAHGMIHFIYPVGECGGKNMAYWAGQTPVVELPLRSDRWSKAPAIKAGAKLNGKTIRVEFDTGATSVVSLAAAHAAGVTDAEMLPAGEVRGAGEGTAKRWIAPVGRFELGGESSVNNRLQIADFTLGDVDMLVGIDFFLSHRIYISKSRGRMYFTYNGGPVFALNGTSAAADPTPEAQAPSDAAGYARRGAARAARHDFVHALEDLDRACEMAPQVADPFTRRGLVHQALKQHAQALQDFDTALRLDPALTDARWERATQRALSGDRPGAIDDLQALDKSLPPQAHLRIEMARFYEKLGMQDQALAQLSLWIPAHRNESDLAHALNSRCWIRMLLGVQLDLALQDCDDALDVQPKDANTLDSHGWVQLRRGKYRDAVNDFNRALAITPQSAWSLYGRGAARLRLGLGKESRSDLDAARKLRPEIDAETGRYGLAVDSSAVPQLP